MKIVGYTSELRAEPGRSIDLHVSSQGDYHIQLIRLICGDPAGPGFKAEKVDASCNGLWPGKVQAINPGSYMQVTAGGLDFNTSHWTFGVWVQPTYLDGSTQTIACLGNGGSEGFRLVIDAAGCLCFEIAGRVVVRAEQSLMENRWFFISAAVSDTEIELKVFQKPPRQSALLYDQSKVLISRFIVSGKSDFYLAASGPGRDVFNGKMASPWIAKGALEDPVHFDPVVASEALVLAAWDFAANPETMQANEVSGLTAHGRLINLPVRGVTGPHWEGQAHDFKYAPECYNAVAFHNQDVGDVGWESSLRFTVPEDLPSGVYAFELSTGDAIDRVPFFVRPRTGKPQAKIAVLFPTLSYLAYANEQIGNRPEIREILENFGNASDADKTYPNTQEDRFMIESSLLGLYDVRRDGSGVCYASKRRPLLSMRPDYHMPLLGKAGAAHQLSADLYLVDWLLQAGYEFDVLTDEDLDKEGAELLQPYSVVLTGSHPEYYTEKMLDGHEGYLNGGGKLMYLGGNGFYWVTSFDPVERSYIEVRRGLGSGSWRVSSAEEYHSTTGERGGLWRFRGRSPQSLVGVGMTSMGNEPGRPYTRTAAGEQPEWQFVFEGLADGQLIGDFPNPVLEYGAGGFEIDRIDYQLGTPASAVCLATARVDSGHSYQELVEELVSNHAATSGVVNDKVRADMVYLNYPNNGAVFSVGSVLWCTGLPYNNYQNSVATVTGNVLDHFLGNT